MHIMLLSIYTYMHVKGLVVQFGTDRYVKMTILIKAHCDHLRGNGGFSKHKRVELSTILQTTASGHSYMCTSTLHCVSTD